jgi:uncharacterized protein YndB with AHSA1/START domain
MDEIEYIGVRSAARTLGVTLKRVYELLYDEKLACRWRRKSGPFRQTRMSQAATS